MIMRNDTPEFEKDNRTPQDRTREFTWILRAAKPLWQQVIAQPENYIAKGLVFTTDRGIRANLSFNKLRKRLILVIRFRPNKELTPLQRQFIRKVQNESQGLSSIAFDEENRILRISSQ